MQNHNKSILSIIIPHYNNFSIINECINSLNKVNFENYEIIVIDNNSQDESVRLIKKNHTNVKIIQSDSNLGYAGGCNYGAEHARGEFLLFLNNDTMHDINFINPLFEFIKSNDNVACVQPKIKNLDDKNYFDYAGASGGFIDYLVFPFCRGRIFNNIEKDELQYNDNKKVFWTSGTAFLTKKSIFNIIGGFDEKLFAHMEEIDYCWKCYLLGYENWVIPQSIIFHKGAQTLGYDSPKKTYLNHRNSIILLLSNYKLSNSLFLFLPKLILEIISSFNDLFRLRIKHFLAHYIAILYVLFNISYLIKRRKHMNTLRHTKDINIFKQKVIFKKSIVKEYFILQNKKYNDIK